MDAKKTGMLLVALTAMAFAGIATGMAGAKELEMGSAPQGVALPGSPYRFLAVTPNRMPRGTVVERIDRDGGRLGRWWYLPGIYRVPAVAYDHSAGGLSADGGTLVLNRLTFGHRPKTTRLAILNTDLYLRHPRKSGQRRPRHAIVYVDLDGHFAFDAISPDGSTIYLAHYIAPIAAPNYIAHFELRALDVRSGRLLPKPIVPAAEPDARMEGLPVTSTTSPDGRWAYTLYDAAGKAPFLHALDTVDSRAVKIALPGLRSYGDLSLLKLRVDAGEHRLELLARSPDTGRVDADSAPVVSIDTQRLRASGAAPLANASGEFLAFAQAPRGPGNLLERTGAAGHSLQGRPIQMRQFGDPRLRGRVLAFACIHGDECAARGIEPLVNGCPDPRANVFVVPNLDPDGFAAGTRLNGRGVDLNRNFASGWRQSGDPGTAEYSGPKPFSEPETRLAARIVEALRPRVTIWFHQIRNGGPFVRVWGQSAPAGRLFAHLARIPFRLMRWPAGTGPNWQNHRFPGNAAYVVELPRGALAPRLAERLNDALDRVGRWEARVGED
jgi:murein peptide amidase A